jgi:hypothetical protein
MTVASVARSRAVGVFSGLLLFVGVFVLLFERPAGSVASEKYCPSPRRTSTSEMVLRGKAVDVPTPKCDDTGVEEGRVVPGVAQVQVASSGRVVHVDVLEPTSGPVAASLSSALANARFQPLDLTNGVPDFRSAKLTYYFVKRGARCVALSPSEAGYVGRWPVAQTAAVRPPASGAAGRLADDRR